MSGRVNDVCTVFLRLLKIKVLLKVSVHLNLLNLNLSTSLGDKMIVWIQSHSGENCIVPDLFFG